MPRRRKNSDPGPGHNGPPAAFALDHQVLTKHVERIEALLAERDELNADIKQIYDLAKAEGFDTKTIRQIVRERRMDADDLNEQLTLLSIYRTTLGMLADTPLGEAAVTRLRSRQASSVINARGPISDDPTYGDDDLPPAA